MNKFSEMLFRKVHTAKSESDFSFFFSLLVTAEALTKIITLQILAALDEDKDRHKYKILHNLVRTSGIGDWSKSIDELLIGTASQYINYSFRPYQAEMTKKVTSDEWQYKSIENLNIAMNFFDVGTKTLNSKIDLKSWFKLFSEFRNKTRGHGAIPPEKASAAAPYLEESIRLIVDNLKTLSLPTAYLKRNLSGKYRVTPISENTDEFSELKSSEKIQLENGVYIFIDGYKKVPLIESDADIYDFYLANGGFNNKTYELLSYVTDNKKHGDSSPFLAPKGKLPASESEGIGELLPRGNCFSNVPDLSYEYIDRSTIEEELYKLIKDDRRAVVTLLGRGGIGKTSLALKVIPSLYECKRFDAIIWFSARDIDLQLTGAKLVRADIISEIDIAKYFAKLVLSDDEFKNTKEFLNYFQEQLTKSDIGPCLFVFDNFETTSNPLELYKLIDTFVRLPNKVLITTRLRDFVGDYPITVHGMTDEESKALIDLTAAKLDITHKLNDEIINEITTVSSGHPYIIKVMLGGFAKNNGKGSLPKIIAGSDEVLTALFERTYAALTPCAQQVFLTLASWNSAVPRIALETILMVSIEEPLEVEKAIEILIQYSMIEEKKSLLDEQYFLGLPYVAQAFGNKKVTVSPLKSRINRDSKLLQKFGPCKLEDKKISFKHHFLTFLKNINSTTKDFEDKKEVIDRICFSFNDGYILVSNWLFESSENSLVSLAKDYCLLYLENEKIVERKVLGWRLLAAISKNLRESLDEVHAILEIAKISNTDFFELSMIVNTVNHKLYTKQLEIEDKSIKNELLSDFYLVLWARRKEGDAVDLSRIAWLALHLNKTDDAKQLVSEGLELDPLDTYCLKLNTKLENLH